MGINQSMDVCQCLATVGGNEEQVDERSMDKFKVYTIDCLEKSALPQLVRYMKQGISCRIDKHTKATLHQNQRYQF
jgi:hypothetical protein